VYLYTLAASSTGGRAKAWCLLIHAEVSLSLAASSSLAWPLVELKEDTAARPWTRAGVTCLLQVLAVLPDECMSGSLSIHPARRAAVAAGLRDAAASFVAPVLDSLAPRATEPHVQILVMESLSAWAAFEVWPRHPPHSVPVLTASASSPA